MIALNFPNAVTSEKDFYARKSELECIERSLLSSARTPVVILGERRIGKTSLLNVAVQRLQGVETRRVVPLYIEPHGITAVDEFAKATLLRLSVYLGTSLEPTGLLDHEGRFHLETIEQFEPAFARLLGENTGEVFILCVDEFDEIVRKASELEFAKIHGLVLFLIEKASLPLALLFTMTRVPDALAKDESSPFTGLAEIVELSPFTLEETAEMVSGLLGGAVAFSAWGQQWLFRMSGGHPYFTKLLLDNLLRQQRPGADALVVTDTMLEEALQDAVNDTRATRATENIYRVHFSPTEKEVVLFLAEREGHVARADLQRAGLPWLTAARRLVGRHYLQVAGGGFDFRIGFLRHWLRNWIEFDEECEKLPALRQRLAEPIEIEVDEGIKQVRVRNRPAPVSPQEYRILQCLAREAGQLVDREQLVRSVWQTSDGVSEASIDQAISRLRKKLGDEFEPPKYIETVRGQGFVLHRAVLIS